MLKKENKFDFKKRMFIVHKDKICDYSLAPNQNEFVIPKEVNIFLPTKTDAVINTAVKDFAQFVEISLEGFCKQIEKKSDAVIIVDIDPKYRAYKSFKIEMNGQRITVTAHDSRGVAQALFCIEKLVSDRRSPFLEIGIIEREPLVSPRMVHSGYSIDGYPDAHLAQIAHAGYDAIMVMTTGPDSCIDGDYDFDDLIERAEKWGIDVYAYSYFSGTSHPDDPRSDEDFQNTFGELFRKHPKFKGVILVGESMGFPSKDPNASPKRYYDNNIDGIPTGIPSSDFWPCKDYRDWLIKLQSVIYPHNKDADIVFWTYNWGYAPKDARQALIRNLPPKITLLVTFETFERYPIAQDVYEQVYDYSLAFVGPGSYFISEAEVAKECGIKLYAMTNTAGNTWDMGGIPYEPMPYQWIKRAEKVIECREKYGLSGLMEGHQYGFTDSIITDLMNRIFSSDCEDIDAELKNIIKSKYGENNANEVMKALKIWSEAINYMPPSGEEQTGAFRVGPSFPFSISGKYMPASDPESRGYFMQSKYIPQNRGGSTLSGVRLPHERNMLLKMLELFTKGCEILDNIKEKSIETEYLCNLGHFMECFARTGINAKDWFITTSKLIIEPDKETALSLIEEAQKILELERENVKKAIPIVENDSRLGWDPRMGYVCDPARLKWKLRLLDYVENIELSGYKRCCIVTDKPNDGKDFEFNF